VLDYMVARYGDFVLYKPPFKTKTALLWLGPFLLLLGGLWLLYRVLRQRRTASSAPLSAADQARARALLGEPAE
jgi:cytochrome c-type biogenesis protein CcmH